MSITTKVIVAHTVPRGLHAARELGLHPRDFRILTPHTTRTIEGLRFTKNDVIYVDYPSAEAEALIARTDTLMSRSA